MNKFDETPLQYLKRDSGARWFFWPSSYERRFSILNYFGSGRILAKIDVNLCLSPYSPNALIFIWRFLLMCFISFCAFSYRAFFSLSEFFIQTLKIGELNLCLRRTNYKFYNLARLTKISFCDLQEYAELQKSTKNWPAYTNFGQK
jgi:hypothetical protein